MNRWPLAALGNVAPIVRRPVETRPNENYPIIAARGFGRGTLHQPSLLGAELTWQKLFHVRSGDLLISNIKAWEGVVGVVRAEDDGCFCSHRYITCVCDPNLAVPEFLIMYLATPEGTRKLAEISPGSADRNRTLSRKNLAELRVPLPPVEEQRRLVDRIDRVASLIDQQKEMHRAILGELDAMLANSFARIITDAPRLTMSEVAPLHRRPVQVEPDGEYPELAVRSFGRGVFHKGTLIGAELTWQSLFRAEQGDLLFSNIKAWEGAFAVVGKNDHGRVGSHRYLTCVPVPNVAESWFLWFHFQTREGLLQIQEASPGSADRNRTLSTKRLMAIKVPVPPIEKQRAFVRLLGQANEARQAIASASSDRDQLLPVLLRQIFADAAKALPGNQRSAA